MPVSVYHPLENQGDRERDQLATEAVVVYGRQGLFATAAELLSHPLRSAATIATAFVDALTSRDAILRLRLRCVPQAIAALGLARRLRRRRVGHLHAHMANTPTTIAMYAAMQLRVPFSFTGHANDLFVHRSLLPEKLRRAAFVACISRWHRGYYRRFADLPDEQLPIIRCGVELQGPAATGENVRESDSDAPPRIVSVGRLVDKKGMDTLIRAVGELGPDTACHCEIIGDGPLREELQALVRTLRLDGKVVFRGACANAEVLERVRHCDLFVLACQRDSKSGDQDGIPVSLMEAMASERCVITSDLEPITELVLDDRTGVCVPQRDPQRLAAAIRMLAADPTRRTRLGKAGREHVVREFDRAANAQALASLFRRCLAGSRIDTGPPRG